MLNMSPMSQTTMNCRDRPSAELRRKFSMICGENTTTQAAMDMELENGEKGVRGHSLASDCYPFCR